MQPDNQQNNPYYPPSQQPVVPPTMQQPVQPPTGQVPMPVNVSAASSSSFPMLWVVLLSVTGLLLVGALIFGFWAFGERSDYKEHSDQKVAAAVKVAERETTEKNTIRFAEESKNPLQKYTGPASYGSVTVEYPKTWSGYIASDDGNSSTPLTAYFHPNVVPAVAASAGRQAVALKVEVLNQAYSQVVNQYAGLVTAGDLTSVPYTLPKVPDQFGVRLSGKLDQQFNGVRIVLPMRDKTVVLTTETDQYLNDFEQYILPNLHFVP